MKHVTLTSKASCIHREALERLLFYNRNQEKVRPGALLAIEKYGAPRISIRNDGLWVTFDSGIEAQTLFLLKHAPEDEQLVGVIVYTRDGASLDILFVAVHEAYAYRKGDSCEMIVAGILNEILHLARRLKGITVVKLFLANPPVEFRVRGALAK